jgi:hypothetical protein
MTPSIRNILATIVGLLLGSLLNMQIITYSDAIIALPEGVDPMKLTPEVLAKLPFKNFIPIFLAHALGTLLAAFVACKLAISRRYRIAIIVGAFFLLGGILASFMIKPPLWYIAVDLLFAYFPFAFLGKKLAGKSSWF